MMLQLGSVSYSPQANSPLVLLGKSFMVWESIKSCLQCFLSWDLCIGCFKRIDRRMILWKAMGLLVIQARRSAVSWCEIVERTPKWCLQIDLSPKLDIHFLHAFVYWAPLFHAGKEGCGVANCTPRVLLYMYLPGTQEQEPSLILCDFAVKLPVTSSDSSVKCWLLLQSHFLYP